MADKFEGRLERMYRQAQVQQAEQNPNVILEEMRRRAAASGRLANDPLRQPLPAWMQEQNLLEGRRRSQDPAYQEQLMETAVSQLGDPDMPDALISAPSQAGLVGPPNSVWEMAVNTPQGSTRWQYPADGSAAMALPMETAPATAQNRGGLQHMSLAEMNRYAGLPDYSGGSPPWALSDQDKAHRMAILELWQKQQLPLAQAQSAKDAVGAEGKKAALALLFKMIEGGLPFDTVSQALPFIEQMYGDFRTAGGQFSPETLDSLRGVADAQQSPSLEAEAIKKSALLLGPSASPQAELFMNELVANDSLRKQMGALIGQIGATGAGGGIAGSIRPLEEEMVRRALEGRLFQRGPQGFTATLGGTTIAAPLPSAWGDPFGWSQTPSTRGKFSIQYPEGQTSELPELPWYKLGSGGRGDLSYTQPGGKTEQDYRRGAGILAQELLPLMRKRISAPSQMPAKRP